jgi:hypothetical protein
MRHIAMDVSSTAKNRASRAGALQAMPILGIIMPKLGIIVHEEAEAS